jgi:hypothetical protein
MANYQSMKYTFSTKDKLHQDYCDPWPSKWKNKEIDTFDKKKLLLGDCCKNDFSKNSIVTMDLKKYGFKFSGKIRVHSKLEKQLESVFQEIAKITTYEIRSVGAYLFRYKKNNSATTNIRDNENYEKAKEWYCKKWNKTEEQKNSWWKEHWAEGAAEYDLEHGTVQKGYLSNHSFGSAIDINPTENGMNATVWDMPAAIVKILLDHGFYWGGFYSSSKDAMHFEYNLDSFLDAPSQTESTPTTSRTDTNITSDALSKAYSHIEKEHVGGYYPIGANTVWHGGIHFHVPQDIEINACMNGTIIAARLPESPEIALKHYGSRNFILLSHDLYGKKVFSLYMHLKNIPLDSNNALIKNISWVNQAGGQKFLDSLKTGKVVKLNVPVHGGACLWHTGEYGSKDSRAKLLHWEIFSQDNVFKKCQPVAGNLIKPQGESPWPSAGGTLLVKEVNASKNTTDSGTWISLRVTKCNHSNAPDTEYKKINWKVTIDGTDQPVLSGIGPVLYYFISSDQKGKKLTFYPYKNSPSQSIKTEVQVSTSDKFAWQEFEDSDSNYNADNKAILNLFGKELLGSDNLLTSDELKKYYKSDAKGVENLRKSICKFCSEWGIPNLDEAIDKLKGRFFNFGLKDRIEPYLFWKEAVDAGVPIPASPNVYHYHPLRFMEAVCEQAVAEKPTLQTETNTPVQSKSSGSSEMIGGETAVANSSCGISYRNEIKCTKYGEEYGPVYWGNKKLENYSNWDKLVAQNAITLTEKEILVGMSENEGNLDAVQSYDSEIVTVGAMQKTINPSGYGEFPTQMAEFKGKNEDKFKALFENCGWTVKNEGGKWRVYYNNLTGADLKAKIRDGFKKDNFGKKVECRPLEPLINAANDIAFQEKQIFDFIDRLKNKVLVIVPKNHVKQISAYVKSKLGKAVVLDHHVNRPGYVKDDFGAALDRFYSKHPTVSKNPADWGANHDSYEKEIIEDYGKKRRGTDMSGRYNKLNNKLG